MENWRQFVKERKLQEATDEEISYLESALEIPPEKLPFGNIFGDKYRFVEELKVIDPNSPFKVTMNALEAMGWNVAEPSDISYDTKNRISGKIWCTKTKITKYIDKNGEIQSAKRAVKLNLPKLLTGIVNFVEKSEPVLRKSWLDTISKVIHRKEQDAKSVDGTLAPPSAEDKYKISGRAHRQLGSINKQEYMSIIKYVSAMHYWLGITPDTVGFTRGIGEFFQIKNIKMDKIKQFSLFLEEKFQNFLKNVNKLYENYYLIYSRHPVDVFRMSDHQGLDSCHSLPSGKSGQWDQYNICALAEAYGNGMIVYAVEASEFKRKGVYPSDRALSELDDVEIFADKIRGIDGIEPSSRVRIRNTSYHGSSDPVRLAVAEKRVYGVELPGFKDKINNRLSTAQKTEIEKITGESEVINLSDFTRYGGDYEDNSVSELIPHLFNKAGVGIKFSGNVHYDWDLQNSLSQKVGGSTVGAMETRLEEIFEGHSGGMFSFSHNVEEDHDGQVIYDWHMFIKFKIKFKANNMPYELYHKVLDIIKDVAEHQWPDYYDLPQTVGVDVAWNDREQEFIVIVDYHSSVLFGYGNLDELDADLENLLNEDGYRNKFDYYVEDGPIQLIVNDLKLNGLIESDEYKVDSMIEKHGLEDKSWWPIVDKETEHSSFGETTTGASFQDEFSIYPDELIQGVPDNFKPAAIRIITEYVNMLAGNWKFATEVVHGQEHNDDLAPITITIDGYILGDGKVPVEDVAEMIKEETELNFMIATGMTNDMSKQKLENIAKFLVEDADVDKVSENIEAKIKSAIADKLRGQVSESRRRIKIKIIR